MPALAPSDGGSAHSTRLRFFAVCTPGLESRLAAELEQLGVTGTSRSGGVEGSCSLPQLWQLHHGSNLAESVRVRLKSFVARDFGSLEQGLARLPWHAYLRPGAPVEVRVACKKSKLYHSDAVAERVQRVIKARLERRGRATRPADAAEPAQTVFVRLDHDEVTSSIDASGERLHKRGYRRAVEVAPLRETLACAMAGWLDELGKAPPTQVWDAFCGSGVLPLEWLRVRSGVAPALSRDFAFERWPMHPRQAYQSWLEARRAGAEDAPRLVAMGSDIDPKAVESARLNAAALLEQAAGAFEHCSLEFAVGDFREAVAGVPPGTAVLCNPPHGRRIGSGARALSLYREFDELLQRREDLRPVVMTCGAADFAKSSRLPWRVLAQLRQGGMPLWLLALE